MKKCCDFYFLLFNLFPFCILIKLDGCLLVTFCSDGETFISADDLRINLWNLEISNQSFNIVDVKPANMEDLTGKLPWKFFFMNSDGVVFHNFLSSISWVAILQSSDEILIIWERDRNIGAYVIFFDWVEF